MKKTLIALAAVAATSAFAQSSVEIYGRLDLGLASTTDKATAAGVEVGRTKSESIFGDQNGRTTSRLGFRGTEDLGGGLKANFNYEVALAPDDTGRTGTADTRSGFSTTRLANLGVSGGFGTVVIGTFLNAIDGVRGYSASTFSAAGGDFLANHAGNFKFNSTLGLNAIDTTDERITVGLSGRSSNSIAYQSPDISGFRFGLGLINDKASATGAVTATGAVNGDGASSSKTSGYILSGTYAAGPLKVSAAHGDAKISNNALSATANSIFGTVNTTQNKVADTAIAASYDFGFVVPYVQYEGIKHTFQLTNGTANGDNIKTSAVEVGARFPMGALTPFVTVGNGSIKVFDAGTSTTAKIDTSSYQVGVTYDLSKRTQLHAAFGQFKIEDKAAAEELKRTGYKVGLIHQF